MNNLIAQTLSSVTLGEPVTFENITMLALLGSSSVEGEPVYLTLDEALGQGTTEITETSELGSVPELRVVNKGAKPVFILDGEELLGAKQNRIVNLSILVPAKSKLTIPVSCVEAGRWRARSRAFSAAPRTQYATGRAKRMAQVTASMQMSGERCSDQAEIWADIAEKSARLDAHSDTGAMEEIFSRHVDFIDRCASALSPVERQSGALFLLNGRIVGFDLFDRSATMRRLLPKLVRSVAVDALDGDSRAAVTVKPQLTVKIAEQFLAVTSAAPAHPSPAIGGGEDIRLISSAISGAALVSGSEIVHLSAFKLNG